METTSVYLIDLCFQQRGTTANVMPKLTTQIEKVQEFEKYIKDSLPVMTNKLSMSIENIAQNFLSLTSPISHNFLWPSELKSYFDYYFEVYFSNQPPVILKYVN